MTVYQRICVPGVVHGLCLTTATIFRRFVWELIPGLFRSDHAPMKITVTGTATTWRLRRIILNCRAFVDNFVREKKSSSQYWIVRWKAYYSHKQFNSWHYTNFHPEATNLPQQNGDCSKALQERRTNSKMVQKDAFFDKLLTEGSLRPLSFKSFLSASFLKPHS